MVCDPMVIASFSCRTGCFLALSENRSCCVSLVANLVNCDTRDDAPCTVQQRVHLHPTLTEQL